MCWSAKAKEYHFKGKKNDSTPPNGGQILKEFLKSQEVDVTPFEKHSGGKTMMKNVQGLKSELGNIFPLMRGLVKVTFFESLYGG